MRAHKASDDSFPAFVIIFYHGNMKDKNASWVIVFKDLTQHMDQKSRLQLLQRIAKDKELPQKAVNYHLQLSDKTLTSELLLAETQKMESRN